MPVEIEPIALETPNHFSLPARAAAEKLIEQGFTFTKLCGGGYQAREPDGSLFRLRGAHTTEVSEFRSDVDLVDHLLATAAANIMPPEPVFQVAQGPPTRGELEDLGVGIAELGQGRWHAYLRGESFTTDAASPSDAFNIAQARIVADEGLMGQIERRRKDNAAEAKAQYQRLSPSAKFARAARK